LSGKKRPEPALTECDWLKTFDVVLHNPPSSIKKWNKENRVLILLYTSLIQIELFSALKRCPTQKMQRVTQYPTAKAGGFNLLMDIQVNSSDCPPE
jgi:hypothetical protein